MRKSKANPFGVSKEHKKTKIAEAMKLLEEIVKVRLAPSPIHGVGVFAMRDIKKGEKLYTDVIPYQFDVPYSKVKKLPKEIKDIILSHFPLVVDGSHFLYPVTKFSAYLNHSNFANYDAKEDKALRTIYAGEEITEDYRLIKNHEKIYTWLLTEKNGIIKGNV